MRDVDRHAHLRIVVSGRVQGVFFRGAAAAQARALGIGGYARNLSDGTVEIVAEGARQALKTMIAWAQRGPSAAHVEEVQVEWGEVLETFNEFKVR
jgi:acylphosphatase